MKGDEIATRADIERIEAQIKDLSKKVLKLGISEASNDSGELLLKAKDAGRLYGVSENTFKEWVKQGNAPAPVDLHGGSQVRWRKADIIEDIAQLAFAS